MACVAGTQHDGPLWSRRRLASYADGLGISDCPKRITVLVNVWLDHRPADVQPLADCTAALLWHAGSAATELATGSTRSAFVAPSLCPLAASAHTFGGAFATAASTVCCPATVAVGAFESAQLSPAVSVGSGEDDAGCNTTARELAVGSFHAHAPIAFRHLDGHLAWPPAPGVNLVRVAHARAVMQTARS